jgi:hypothetical protein
VSAEGGREFLVLNSRIETINTNESFMPSGSLGVAMPS